MVHVAGSYRHTGGYSNGRHRRPQPGPERRIASHPTRKESAAVHLVCCPYCQERFDLFAATWCAHNDTQPSKICPCCDRCMCEHPAYLEPHFWKPAPSAFQQRGFDRLFLFYL